MQKALMILTLVVAAAAEPAMAEDCLVPMADWQPREAVAQLAAEKGWTVRRIKIDDGCYEIDGTDAEERRIEVKVDPATLQVIEVEYEDDDDRPGRVNRRTTTTGPSIDEIAPERDDTQDQTR